MENRVTAHAKKIQSLIDAGGKDGALDTPEKLQNFSDAMDLDSFEFFAFQQAQAQAHVSGKLTTDEAQTVYIALGGEVQSGDPSGWPATTPLAMRVTITNLMGQLVGVRA